ncbi:hypothetical protein G6F45_014272 [Rhizopus arrhizus]|nr:hypothetical protein G6F45_014272 [Rhizopus arrhizus]
MARGGGQPPVAERDLAAGLGHLEVGRQHARAAQDRLDARQQFARDEGFDQVVVGAHFQADDAVHVVAAGPPGRRRRAS